jgi:hypothetical protein
MSLDRLNEKETGLKKSEIIKKKQVVSFSRLLKIRFNGFSTIILLLH